MKKDIIHEVYFFHIKRSAFNYHTFLHIIYYIIIAHFFQNQPNEMCSHSSEQASKGSFLGPVNSKITQTKEKERRKRKSEEEELERRRRGKWLPS